MNMKTLALGIMAASLAGGAALAASGGNTSALDDPAKMGAFYTDSDMKTMKSDDEFKAAWMALTDSDRGAITTACADELKDANATNTHPEFCSNVKALGGEEGSGG